MPIISEKAIKHFRRLIKHSNFIVYHPKQIFEDYMRILAKRLFGWQVPRYGHNWERFFKVERADVVIDIGAWPGRFIYLIADTASKIIAIEPEPYNFTDLNQKIKMFPNVIVIKKAVWNCKRKVPLYISSNRDANSLISDVQVGGRVTVGRKTVMVEGDTLDNIISGIHLERVDFVKMDIEGAELEALEGAKNLLQKLPKIVVASYHIREERKTVKEVDEILIRNGFRTWVADDDLVYGYKPKYARASRSSFLAGCSLCH